MKTLLYFEEYDSQLSYELRNRKDINVIFIRADKSRRFFSRKYLDKYNDFYQFSYESDFEQQVQIFKNWLNTKGYKIDYFLNDSEYYMEYSNKIARALNLECLSEQQVKWVRNKVNMKDKFREIGLKTVEYRPVESKRDILEFFKEMRCQRIVFKPKDEMNSFEVYMIDSIEDIDNLPVEITPDKYMVEQFTNAHEWSIESLVQDGKVLDSYLTYIPGSTIKASINGGLNCHMQLIHYPKFFKENPKEYIQKIVDGMNLKNGAMTIEVFVSNDGEIIASEMGWRFPGCQTTKNISVSRGFNIFDTLIDIAVHNPVTLNYKKEITCPGDIYLPNKEGKITMITSIDELKQVPGFVDGEMYVKENDVVTKRRVGTDASGWVMVQSASPRKTMEIMRNIYNNFVINTEKEQREENTNVKKRSKND